jgi:hypothetical protein
VSELQVFDCFDSNTSRNQSGFSCRVADDACRTEVGDWHWDGLPGGELPSLKANGGDGVIKPAIRIWEEKIKVISGLAGRPVVGGGGGAVP